MTTTVTETNSTDLVQDAVRSNQSTLLMQAALLGEILKAQAGAPAEAADSVKSGSTPDTTTVSAISAVTDQPLTPAQQGMVLLGDLAYLDLLAQQANRTNPPAGAQAAFQAELDKINQLIAGAPAGSIDPMILSFAQYVTGASLGPLGPLTCAEAYEGGLNNTSQYSASSAQKYPTIVDWISANVQTLSGSGNLTLAGSIAVFMIGVQADMVNQVGTQTWSNKFQALLKFWSSKDQGEPIPQPASSATADLVLYFFWSQAGSPQPPGNWGDFTPNLNNIIAWNNFQTNLENFMAIADPKSEHVDPQDPNSPVAPGWDTDNVAAGYNDFFQTLQTNLDSWKNGLPVYSANFLQNFMGVWTSYLTYKG